MLYELAKDVDKSTQAERENPLSLEFLETDSLLNICSEIQINKSVYAID